MGLEKKLRVIDLGSQRYASTWTIQQELLQKRMNDEIEDTLLLVEHDPPVVTFGLNEEWNQLKVPQDELSKLGFDFHNAQRGGGVAFHGPGQLVGYTIMEVMAYGGILKFLKSLEDVMMRTASDFGIDVQRIDTLNPTTNKPYRSTWYKGDGSPKVLCSKGIGCRPKGDWLYTHHGFALNVNQGPSYTHLLDPCGFPVDKVLPVSMEEIKGKRLHMGEVKNRVVRNFSDVFGKLKVDRS